MTDQHTCDNPVTRYSTDIPSQQHQSEPGLETELTPTPDLGETTYRGTGRLTGRRALITGGDSGIGAAVAIAFAREGADVAVSSFPRRNPMPAASLRSSRRRVAPLSRCPPTSPAQRPAAPGRRIVDHQHDVDPGLRAIPILVDYATTKASINTFTKALAQQLAERGIRVNAVAPGPIWTALQVSDGQPQDALDECGQSTPLGPPVSPLSSRPRTSSLRRRSRATSLVRR